MLKTAEAVSIGHPDKTADYISSYILDRLIEQDPGIHYAVEVMIKDNCVMLGGEVKGSVDMSDIETYVCDALREIGYDEHYSDIWKNYACKGPALINRELWLARKLNDALYEHAKTSSNLGLDIKTQITIDDATGDIVTAIVAIPMLEPEDIKPFVVDALGQEPKYIIVNGTGIYQFHSSIADCGITGRKLACDFYSTACPIGGGSPWTKDPSKADLTLNVYARYLATEHLGDNDECFVYLSSCIGKSELPSGLIRTVKNGVVTEKNLFCNEKPNTLIKFFGLDRPIYTKLCRKTLQALTIVPVERKKLVV